MALATTLLHDARTARIQASLWETAKTTLGSRERAALTRVFRSKSAKIIQCEGVQRSHAYRRLDI
jgi:hypothetical protein